MMYNLSNLENFLLEDEIDTINKFIGEPLAITTDKNANDIDEETRAFLYRLAKAIRENQQNKNCQRNCIFRKIGN